MTLTSVVIPVLNEGAILEDKIKTIENVLNTTIGAGNWSFVFVDNGSKDNTGSILNDYLKRNSCSKKIFLPNPNYGEALKVGISSCSSQFVIILDLDHEDHGFIRQAWENRHSFPIVNGSKRIDPTICIEPKFRTFLSWGLNALINLAFRYPGTDTHGPKLLDMNVIGQIVKASTSSRGQYDMEIVLRSFYAGHAILEVPIRYVNLRKPRSLMISKILRNCWGLFKLHQKLSKLEFSAQPKYTVHTKLEEPVNGKIDR